MKDNIKVGDKVMHNNLVCHVLKIYNSRGHREVEIQPVGSSSRISALESEVTHIMTEGRTEQGGDFLND